MKKKYCTCDEDCLCCVAEELTVSDGSEIEAKQYEYGLSKKLHHPKHEHKKEEIAKKPVNHNMMDHAQHQMPEMKEMDHEGHKVGEHAHHEMVKMSHMDHEAAMTNPQMAKAMEADMRLRFLISFILSIPVFLYSPVGMNILKVKLLAPIPVNWIMLILTTPIVFWAGSIFITGTYF
jgi:Cu2+-exporting ATPase